MDPAIVQIIRDLIPAIQVAFLAWMTYLGILVNIKQDQAAKKVQEVKIETVKVAQEVKEETTRVAQEVNDKLKSIVKTGEKNHVLLNSGMGTALSSVATLSRWKADQTKNPEHIAAAEMAEKKFNEHESRQANADAGTKL